MNLTVRQPTLLLSHVHDLQLDFGQIKLKVAYVF